jgi:type VI secretion system protein ImpF
MATDLPSGDADSLLDKLTTDTVGGEAWPNRSRSRRATEDVIRRDLENLLNTRWRCLSSPAGLEELERSLVNYGIPDFTGMSFADAESQRELRRILEHCIQHFEPRLRMVRVSLQPRGERQDRVLRFRIEAELRSDGGRRSVAFETTLDPAMANFRVGFIST